MNTILKISVMLFLSGFSGVRAENNVTVEANVTTSQVSDIFINSMYFFNVAAFNDEGISAKSNTAILNVINSSGIQLEQPVNSSTLYQTIPYLSWSHESPGPFLGYYEIMIDDDSDFSSPEDRDTVPAFIDYHPNSLYQIGGIVKNFDKVNRTFDVVVDTSVYKTYDVLKNYTEGYFLSGEHGQKIGLKGVHYQMEQTWEQARVSDTLFRFTGGSSEYGRYRDELEDGDYFVLSHRGGDIVQLVSGVDNFVVSNMTTHASRGRYFAIGAGCSNSRCLNNNYLKTQGRIMGSSSGGVGVDRGDNIWYEGNRYEYTRDDMFHNGSNAGKGSVYRRNHLTVYPNPSTDGFFQASRHSDFLVMDSFGRALKALSNTNYIDLSEITAGFFVLIDRQSGETCKLIKSVF